MKIRQFFQDLSDWNIVPRYKRILGIFVRGGGGGENLTWGEHASHCKYSLGNLII